MLKISTFHVAVLLREVHRDWLREQADRVLLGWLNEVSAETEDA